MLVFLLNNWRAIVVALALSASFYGGWYLHKRIIAADQLAVAHAEIEHLKAQHKEALEKSLVIEKQIADTETKQEVRYVEVKKFIDRPVYRDCAIDDDGMRALSESIRAANATRQRSYAVQ